MKRVAILLGIVALGAIVGCADERKLYRDNTSQADYNKDAYECERDTRMSAVSFGGGIVGSMNAKDFAIRCMQARGYEYR
jgi:hypothetical protein